MEHYICTNRLNMVDNTYKKQERRMTTDKIPNSLWIHKTTNKFYIWNWSNQQKDKIKMLRKHNTRTPGNWCYIPLTRTEEYRQKCWIRAFTFRNKIIFSIWLNGDSVIHFWFFHNRITCLSFCRSTNRRKNEGSSHKETKLRVRSDFLIPD